MGARLTVETLLIALIGIVGGQAGAVSSPKETQPALAITSRGVLLDSHKQRRSEYFIDQLRTYRYRMMSIDQEYTKRVRAYAGFGTVVGFIKQETPGRHYSTQIRSLYFDFVAAKWHFFEQGKYYPETLLLSERVLWNTINRDLAGRVIPYFGDRMMRDSALSARDPYEGRTNSELIRYLWNEREKYDSFLGLPKSPR